jgi:hypothetical protein
MDDISLLQLNSKLPPLGSPQWFNGGRLLRFFTVLLIVRRSRTVSEPCPETMDEFHS